MTDDIKTLLMDLRYTVDRHLQAQQSQEFWQAAKRSQELLDRIDAALAGGSR